MIGSNTPPYPKRCGELGCVYGSARYQHTIKSVIADKYKNTTAYAIDGVTGMPEELWYHDNECSDPQDPPYVDQLGTILDTVMDGYQFTGNAFTRDGTIDLTQPCRLGGFKTMQAQKFWHGMYDFEHYGSGKDCATNTVYADTKYRTIAISIEWFFVDNNDPCVNQGTFTVQRTYTVDRYSGLISQVSCSTSASGGYTGGLDPDTYDWSPFYVRGCGYPDRLQQALDAQALDPVSWDVSITTDTATKLVYNYAEHTDPSLGPICGDTPFIYNSATVSIELSDPYTIAQVKTDAETLAAEIDLNDHVAYPFRTDGNSFIAPLVIYNEVTMAVSPLVWHSCGWNDPNATTINSITGADNSDDIIGALLPAGYGEGSPRGVFRITHQNFYRSICGTPPAEAIGQRTMGKWTPNYLPANCGLWTQDVRFANTITPNLMWPCQFIVANTDGIYLQKWLETLIPPPNGSYNAARPYGKDRFRIDETQVYCYEAGYIRDQDSNPIVSTTFTGLWGGISVDGFYSGCSTDITGVLTLGTKVLDVPTDWTLPSEDQDDVFAKLRWEDATKHVPGFGGKLNVTATYDSGANKTTFTYTDSPYIVDSDKISVMGFGDAILGTNLTLTRLGDTSCTVSGDYSTALWIVPYKLFDGSTDGTKYYFANDTHKSTFVARTWTMEMDGWTITDSDVEQSCIAISPCTPQTLLASPNGEAGDYEMDWPASIDPNTVWLGQFMQWMQDPFYQTPHEPCGGGPAPDTTCKIPYIEARIAVGTNYGLAQNETAPTPPSPINLAATAAPPDTADLTGTGAIVDLLNNPTTPFTVWAACGDDPVAT